MKRKDALWVVLLLFSFNLNAILAAERPAINSSSLQSIEQAPLIDHLVSWLNQKEYAVLREKDPVIQELDSNQDKEISVNEMKDAACPSSGAKISQFIKEISEADGQLKCGAINKVMTKEEAYDLIEFAVPGPELAEPYLENPMFFLPMAVRYFIANNKVFSASSSEGELLSPRLIKDKTLKKTLIALTRQHLFLGTDKNMVEKYAYAFGVTSPTASSLFPTDKSGMYLNPNQRGIGNCYLIALMTGIAKFKPDHLKSMIQTGKRGKGFNVRFYKQNPTPEKPYLDVYTNPFFNMNRYAYSHYAWVSVLEHAFYEYVQIEKIRLKWKCITEACCGAENTTQFAMKAFFGKDPEIVNKNILSRVKAAFSSGKKIIILGTDDLAFGKPAEFPPGHAYTLLDIKGTAYQLRNPWGVSDFVEGIRGLPDDDGVLDGVFWVSEKWLESMIKRAWIANY